MYRAFIESFLPRTLAASGQDLRTDRIFINVLVISALADLLGIGLAVDLTLQMIAWLLLANACINLILLLLYKNGVSRILAAHVFLLQHAVSFVLQAWYQGGLITPATGAYFLLPAVSLLIIGKRAAVVWFLITAAVITGFYVYESSYGAPELQYPPDKRAYLFYGSVLGTNISMFILMLVYENSKNKALRLAEKKHSDLVAAQVQLVQSEKMASLGELTAGIAHEIQNPLNFVNNFSEVSNELIKEILDLRRKTQDNTNSTEEDELLNDIASNLEKINHHGKRADGIVKGMLQHSRTSSGQKEPTDINVLCDEYLRLAYHGLRAKDKSFNAKFNSHFDDSVGKVNVVPQEMGRVILNLINNAFYAVNEKEKRLPENYEPTVTVSTRKESNKVIITIADNGDGIPAAIKDKIFQPFFTTKPTGQGTGLGLSLSYDIVKAHGGELKVETKEQEGTSFIINLPL